MSIDEIIEDVKKGKMIILVDEIEALSAELSVSTAVTGISDELADLLRH